MDLRKCAEKQNQTMWICPTLDSFHLQTKRMCFRKCLLIFNQIFFFYINVIIHVKRFL